MSHARSGRYELRPATRRYGYVYAVGLDSQGKTAEAVEVLTAVQRARPADRDVLVALAELRGEARATGARPSGGPRSSWRCRPEDAEARALLAQVQAAGAPCRWRPIAEP